MYWSNGTLHVLSEKTITSSVRVVTPPAAEPVTLAEAKTQLHIAASDDSHDDELADLIAAAREEWEQDTSLALITRTLEHSTNIWQPEIRLTVRPVLLIESVKYLDVNGAEQTVSSAEYYADRQYVTFVSTFAFPALSERTDAIRIRYKAGYAEDSRGCPQLDRQAIKMSLAHRFENRDMLVNDIIYVRRAYEALVAKRIRSSYP